MKQHIIAIGLVGLLSACTSSPTNIANANKQPQGKVVYSMHADNSDVTFTVKKGNNKGFSGHFSDYDVTLCFLIAACKMDL